MAEFTQKAKNKRILRSIDTAKASKSEVYDFYKQWRKRQGVKGKALAPTAKKSEIVQALERLEQRQSETIKEHSAWISERNLNREYERLTEAALSQTPAQIEEQFEKFEEKLQKKAPDLQEKFSGRFKATTEAPKPRYRRSQDAKNVPQKKNVYYKGKFAHDYIKKMVDDDLLDTDSFYDSQEIWAYISDTTSSKDYDFFADNYSGKYKKGSKDYYEDFLEFRQDTQNFERALKKKKLKVPKYGTKTYWRALKKWQQAERKKGGLLGGGGGGTKL